MAIADAPVQVFGERPPFPANDILRLNIPIIPYIEAAIPQTNKNTERPGNIYFIRKRSPNTDPLRNGGLGSLNNQ
jgi:hypothetical protein